MPKNNKPKKRIGAIFNSILLVAFAACFFFLQVWEKKAPTVPLSIHDQVLYVEVADSAIKQYTGLGQREVLGDSDGMLFVFGDVDRHGIVMRDMQFSLDIIWLLNGEVVDIAAHIAPEPGVAEAQLIRYLPRKPANMVLELPAGGAEHYAVSLGDVLGGVGNKR